MNDRGSDEIQSEAFLHPEQQQPPEITPVEDVTYPYPKSVFFLIGNVFCERFNYLGMRSIHSLYFNQKLKFSKDIATVLYHVFTVAVYFMCVLGAIISDSWLGKFKSIIFLSIVYATGTWIVVLGAIPQLNLSSVTTLLGLVLIAIGSGGVKPCLSAFGGDQFKLPAQAVQMATFFSIFYSAINAGSLIAKISIPILRQDVHCFGENDCYSLAFGVPGILMIIAIAIFLSGKKCYTIKAPTENMIVLVTKCIKNAAVINHREGTKNPRVQHWLDHSEEKYGKQLVDDIKVLLNVLVLYIPMPLFWALFDQQGSRWTFQAQNMDGNIGFYTIKPDQMHVVNPLLVLIFIPIFETVIYPLLAKVGIRRPLQKIAIGMLMAAVAFLLSGLVQMKIENAYSSDQTQWRLINGLPCDFTVRTNQSSSDQFELHRFQLSTLKNIESKAPVYEFTLVSNDSQCPSEIQGKMILESSDAATYFVSGPKMRTQDVLTETSPKSKIPLLRILFSSLTAEVSYHEEKIITPNDDNRVRFVGNSTYREQFSIESGTHHVFIDDQMYETITLKDGSVNTLLVFVQSDGVSFQTHLIEESRTKAITMLWLLPQYVFITLAEVMFVVTSLEFSYSEAPECMKSVMQACWLLTTAVGNILITLIAGLRIFHSQANEFFLYSVAMLADMLLFAFLSNRYKSENRLNSTK